MRQRLIPGIVPLGVLRNHINKYSTILHTMEYSGAGVLFTDRRLALAGYHPHKHFLSGLGGKREVFYTGIQETAFRELLEELFAFSTISSSLISLLCETFSCPDIMLCDSNYIVYVYSFEHLRRLLHICKSADVVSPLYSSFPDTLEALLFQRQHVGGIEISHLALLPVVEIPPTIDPLFQQDLQKIRIE